MPISNFPNGFSHGVNIQGFPVLNTYGGNVFWVDSNGPGGKTGTFKQPVVSINAAVDLCTASNADIIMLKPGHVEDLADTSSTGAIDLDKAGISVIGLGSGSLQPRIDFNHADSDFLVGANDITIENVHFDATVTGVKLGVAIEAAVTGTTIRGCRFTVETTTTDEFVVAINLLAGCDDTVIVGNHIDMGLGGATDGIKLTGASSNVKIVENMINGDYSTACVTSDTTLSLEVLIKDNILIQGGPGGMNAQEAISMLTGTTGYVIGNMILSDVATGSIMAVGDTMVYMANFAADSVGVATQGSAWTDSATVAGLVDG